jgi:hypothetical protein
MEMVKPAAVRFKCPSCGRKYATKPELAGKKIRCTACGVGVRVPGNALASPGDSSQPALNVFDVADETSAATSSPPARSRAVGEDEGSSSFIDKLAARERTKRPKGESVLPSRAALLEQVRLKAAEDAAAEQAAAAEAGRAAEADDDTPRKKKKKRKKKRGAYFDPKDTLILIGGVAAFVGLLTMFALAYPDFRFPLGLVLCAVGFVVYLMGAASLRQLAAEEGTLKLILYRVFPPYQWWFVITRWSDTKDFAIFFASGLTILAIGSAVLKTSPVGKKTAESERALKKAQHEEENIPPSVLPNVMEVDVN